MIEFFKTLYKMLKNPHDPNWHLKRKAKPSERHPLAGIWKKRAFLTHGLAIGPNGKGSYYITFFGPGGCHPKGAYMPNSSIVGDPRYEIVDENTIKIRIRNRAQIYRREIESCDT